MPSGLGRVDRETYKPPVLGWLRTILGFLTVQGSVSKTLPAPRKNAKKQGSYGPHNIICADNCIATWTVYSLGIESKLRSVLDSKGYDRKGNHTELNKE